QSQLSRLTARSSLKLDSSAIHGASGLVFTATTREARGYVAGCLATSPWPWRARKASIAGYGPGDCGARNAHPAPPRPDLGRATAAKRATRSESNAAASDLLNRVLECLERCTTSS